MVFKFENMKNYAYEKRMSALKQERSDIQQQAAQSAWGTRDTSGHKSQAAINEVKDQASLGVNSEIVALRYSKDASDKLVAAQDLAAQMREAGKDFAKKQALVTQIENTNPQVLITKVGDPPKSLLAVAEETRQGNAGVALLNTAKFPVQDMKIALSSYKAREQQQSKQMSLSHSAHTSLHDTLAHHASVSVPAASITVAKGSVSRSI